MEAVEAWGEWEADTAVPSANPAAAGSLRRHIKKRALKNKALSVSFNEKDLKCVFPICLLACVLFGVVICASRGVPRCR